MTPSCPQTSCLYRPSCSWQWSSRTFHLHVQKSQCRRFWIAKECDKIMGNWPYWGCDPWSKLLYVERKLVYFTHLRDIFTQATYKGDIYYPDTKYHFFIPVVLLKFRWFEVFFMQRFVLEWKPLGRYFGMGFLQVVPLIVLSVFFYHHIQPTCNYKRHKVTTWRIYWGYILPPPNTNGEHDLNMKGESSKHKPSYK